MDGKERNEIATWRKVLSYQSVGLSWEGQNYYLVGYDSEAEKIKHYRVDKMLHIQVSEEKREGEQHFQQLDMADYAKRVLECMGKRTASKIKN